MSKTTTIERISPIAQSIKAQGRFRRASLRRAPARDLERERGYKFSASRNIESAMLELFREMKAWDKPASQATFNHYTTTFRKFGAWLDEQQITQVAEISKSTMREFFAYLNDSGLTPRSVRGYHIDLTKFFKFLVEEEYVQSSPMAGVKRGTMPKPTPDHFSTSEWESLVNECKGDDIVSLRNMALIRLLLDSGVRLSECANFKIGDIDLDSGSVRVIEGKGGKSRNSMISPKTIRAISKYLAQRKDTSPDAKLWIGERGELTHWGIGNIIAKLGKAAGIPKCCPHKFRRTCAITMLRSGATMFAVKNMLGHEDFQVLQHYVQYLDSDVAKEHTQHSAVKFFGV